MPLRDHFNEPYTLSHGWDEFHGGWPMEIVRVLQTILPPNYRSAPQIFLSSGYEIDIGTVEDGRLEPNGGGGGTATLVAAAPAPTFDVDADLVEDDEYTVEIYDTRHGRKLVATIELVSPANKDRPRSPDKFVEKCEELIQAGVCVSIVDLVTTKRANLYDMLLDRFRLQDPNVPETKPTIYAATVRGRRQAGCGSRLNAWYYPMTLGQPLPTLPIWLTEDLRVLLPLETSYEEVRRVLRVP